MYTNLATKTDLYTFQVQNSRLKFRLGTRRAVNPYRALPLLDGKKRKRLAEIFKQPRRRGFVAKQRI